MELYIDNKLADTDQSTRIAISLSIASVTDPGASKTGYSKTIRIPATACNREIMGDSEQINGATLFNQQAHTARIASRGCTIIEGIPQLLRHETGDSGTGWYEIAIAGAGRQWVRHAAETPFRQTAVDFRATIDGQTVEQSWSWEKPVRFLPVKRDRQAAEADGMYPPVRIRSFEDYHPFIHAGTLLRTILGEAGYTLRSEFAASPLFDSLYVSGRYPTRDVGAVRQRVDFRAGRFGEKTAQADRFGRVYADPLVSFNTIGTLVDTADPKEEQDGQVVEGVFNRNNCFRKDGDRIAFIPPEAVTVGFEYRIHYTTDFVMKNRRELTCFDRLYIDEEQERRFKVPNPHKERRDSFVTGKAFRLFVFDYTAGETYDLQYDCLTSESADPDNLQPGEHFTATCGAFTADTKDISVTTPYRVANPRVIVKKAGATAFVPFTGEWGLYDGYVNKTGTTEVMLTVRSAPERILPSQPKYFDYCYFGGAKQGMSLTIGRKTEIRPVFLPHPAVGSTVGFEDIAAHAVSQIDFVNSLRHMFNLYFYTDEIAREVIMEPRRDFYRDDAIVDWSDRIDLDRPITVEEPGSDLAARLTWTYQDGDGAVARWNETNSQKFGLWSMDILNRCAKAGEKTLRNPLFTPSLNGQEALSEAPDASLVQVGDRNRTGQAADTEDLNFPPKIVRYLGMTALPEGQLWGWPGFGEQYPLAAFLLGDGASAAIEADTPTAAGTSGGQGTGSVNLCFEDRNGITGLHQYYDDNAELYNRGRRVTAYLHLTPEDIEPLIAPNRLGKDFRAAFKLRIGGEGLLFRLEAIEDFTPESGVPARCTFIQKI